MTQQDAPNALYIRFHGRILEHLGIQTYQSPVNSIAELVANAWDADAEKVQINLPGALGEDAVITIEDDGNGMTFADCQDRFLNVGWNRRGADPDEKSPVKGRPVLGRKGIGKFAGFGIAQIITIDTTSRTTGERTVFALSLANLLSDEFVSTVEKAVDVIRQDPPNASRIPEHGTTLTLSGLSLKIAPSATQFAISMGRRFLLHQRQEDFHVLVNGNPLPDALDLGGVEFVFPRDYEENERPEKLKATDEDGWGTEEISNGQDIKWRFLFYKETLDEEELAGIAVFAKGKLAQAPFLFNLAGGLGGQHGVSYLTGQVEADFLDAAKQDLIATERQRINWEHEASLPVLRWGQERVKQLLVLWRARRGAERLRELELKISTFSPRLDRLGPHEAKTVKTAISRLAQIPTLSRKQFEDLGEAVLTAWESGRLRELIHSISEAEDLQEGAFVELLAEAQVLTALNIAEAVETKLATVGGLQDRIRKKDLEKAVRDYIAANPWLIAPEWETFRVERSVAKLVRDAAIEAGFDDDDFKGRTDLVLASGSQLLVLEFMRPGITLDWDHLQRFERYVTILRSSVRANTGGQFESVTGYMVADSLTKSAANLTKIETLKKDAMLAMDWQTLLGRALSQWEEFLDAVIARSPKDARLTALRPPAQDMVDTESPNDGG
jgi:hypothetical protein